MSEFKIRKLTDRAGTGAPNFTHGFNINGSDSGLIGVTHTEGSSEPSSSSNGDTWWDTGNDKYYVYIDGEFKEYAITASGPFYYGNRGFRAGGAGANNNIDYYDISTLGNMSDFGNLTRNFQRGAGASNGTRALFMGGSNATGAGNNIHGVSNYTNVIDYITCATTGNATDYGDASGVSIDSAAVSDATTAVHYLSVVDGVNPGTNSDKLDKHTIDTTGNATDFGNLTQVGWVNGDCGVSNGTRGLFAGGAAYSNPWGATNPIDYITIATPGNSTDFGDLSQAKQGFPGVGSGTSGRGIWAGGYTNTYVNAIDYVTISTTGNAADFGDLTGSTDSTGMYQIGAAHNATRGVFHYGGTSTGQNTMSYITMATTGNSADFGDQLTTNNTYARATSGAAS